MPINVETVTAHVEKIEGLIKNQSQQPLDILNEIRDALTNIGTLYIVFDQMERLSENRLPWRREMSPRLNDLLARLRPLIDPYSKNSEYRIIIGQIKHSLPMAGEEEAYIDKLTQRAAKSTVSGRRSYIPQRFVGIANVSILRGSVTEVAFMATSGLGPCVGYVLFSKTAECCALAHFDDLCNATVESALPADVERARRHYRGCAQRILDVAKGFSTKAEVAEDWSVILLPSDNPLSRRLQALLQEAIKSTGVEITISEPETGDQARNVLIEFAQLDPSADLKPRKYTEIVPFADLPPDLLTLREALRLPTAGFTLYHIQEGALDPQDVNGFFSMVDNYITPRPLAAGAASVQVADQAVQASVIADTQAAVGMAGTALANPPGELSHSDALVDATGVKAPLLSSQQSRSRPPKRERSKGRPDDGQLDDPDVAQGVSTDQTEGAAPPPKRPGGSGIR